MKTPDKIYIQPNAHGRWFEGNKPNDNFVDYLRKDALIEWAKEHYDRFKFLYNIKRASVVYGKMDTYKEMIDKIESL